ncbi:hypothetical protein ACJMK2_008596 [Sinanodonta woodiana]|uniref:Fucosyltransferase n=1 Tax=Sinanodonta woodiana TaxID=1069815 RepID=A0ABD3VQ53_SINWO
MEKKRTLSVLVVMTTFVILIVTYSISTQSQLIARNRNFLTVFHPRNVTGPNYGKKILFWTPMFEVSSKELAAKHRRCLLQCDVNCTVTSDRREVMSVDAVMFHLRDLWVGGIGTKRFVPIPGYRRPSQVWVLYNMESLAYLQGDLNALNGYFNWTVWYRKDSTISIPYGQVSELSETEITAMSKHLETRNFFREKSKAVTGMISHCKDYARRYKVIHELKTYINIEMFGDCYGKPCKGNFTECEDMLRKYKFYLALENSICKDYVTEKYWGALARNQVPIVNWKNISDNIVIPNSYINIHDFKDMKALASYLTMVGNNETLYNSYFTWKKRLTNRSECFTCKLCRALYNGTTFQHQVYSDIDAWLENDICQKTSTFANIYNDLDWHFFKIYS